MELLTEAEPFLSQSRPQLSVHSFIYECQGPFEKFTFSDIAFKKTLKQLLKKVYITFLLLALKINLTILFNLYQVKSSHHLPHVFTDTRARTHIC